jgi:hypothetical protein
VTASQAIARLRALREKAELSRPTMLTWEREIVDALPALLECADALEKIASSPTGGVGCNPAEFVKDARAALQALAEGHTP